MYGESNTSQGNNNTNLRDIQIRHNALWREKTEIVQAYQNTRITVSEEDVLIDELNNIISNHKSILNEDFNKPDINWEPNYGVAGWYDSSMIT